VLAPLLIDIIDVIAIPRLTLLFGNRLLHFGACAAAKACHEKSKKADNFHAGEYVFHIFLVPDALKSLPVSPPSIILIIKLSLADLQRLQGRIVDPARDEQFVEGLEPANCFPRFWADYAIDLTVIVTEFR
jgi:hypothetical protein